MQELRELIRAVPDFPEPGILFRDITPLLADPRGFQQSIEALATIVRTHQAQELLAIESRGFVFGAALSLELGLPLHLVRKAGKLPRETIAERYSLEYGADELELHSDVILPGVRYAVIDDLIATGGTVEATVRLVQRAGGQVACCAFLIELLALEGRVRLPGVTVESVLQY